MLQFLHDLADFARTMVVAVYTVLLETVVTEDPWVRLASLLQLAVLASCPNHRGAFFEPGTGAAAVLASLAMREDLDTLFPPRKSLQKVSPLLTKTFEAVIGAPYDATHPKCVLAKAFSSLTEYESCCPEVSAGRALLHRDDLMKR